MVYFLIGDGILCSIMNHGTYQSKVLITTAWSIWALLIAAYAAMKFNIYYTLPWFDTAMHFCGGIVTALVVYVLLHRLRWRLPNTLFSTIAMITIFAFGIGFFWEVCEYVVNIIIPTYVFDPVDTITDLIADTSGSFIASAIIMARSNQHHGNK